MMTKQRDTGPAQGYGNAFGSGRPIGGRTEVLPPAGPASSVHAEVPPGVHSDTMHQQMAPFVGSHALPTGQTISVNMNAPNPNLTLKEWMIRGALGGAGRVVSWPFRLVGLVFEGIAHGVIKVVTWAMIIVLVPTLIMIGGRLETRMEHQKSIREGASEIMHDGRQAAGGIRDGATDEMRADRTDSATGDQADDEVDASKAKRRHHRQDRDADQAR